MPAVPAEHDFDGFSGIEGITSSGSRNRSGWRGRSQVRALPYIIRCKDIELHLAWPWLCGGHEAVADAILIDSFKPELPRFKPGAQAPDSFLIGTDVDRNIDVVG